MIWLTRLGCRLLPFAIVLATTAHAAEPLTIGLDLGQIGALAPNGRAALLAMQIWVEDTNAKGGLLGRTVKLITYDDQSNPALVPGIISKLLDVDHGTSCSRATAPTWWHRPCRWRCSAS